ncbi:MAG: L-aspartate oxidase [Planctomycetota bacterium]
MLVLGAGVAGLQAALAAADEGADVLVVAKSSDQATATAWSQGGIAVAFDPEDSSAAHAEDTLRVGCGLCDEAVVRCVTEGGVAEVERLVERGARFDRDTAGALSLGHEAAHTYRRVIHHGDTTGREIMRALTAAAAAHPGIRRHDGFVADLLTDGDRCVGALLHDRADGAHAVFARATVLATGGAGRLYRESSNPRPATGDGMAAAFRAGAALRDMEFVQFHPTTRYLAGSPRVLVTEAVRGEGAHVVDDHGVRFLVDAHADAELAPRDVVSRAIVQHLAREDVRDIYLDLRHFPAGKVASRFPGLHATCARHGLDPQRDLVPVRPAAHYTIGGVAATVDGATSLDGLYACGEVAASGLHGANRLASNSLLEGLVLGPRTGRAAARASGTLFTGVIAHRTQRGRDEGRRDEEGLDEEDLRKSLLSRMWRRAGILRDGEGLRECCEAIRRWRTLAATSAHFGRAGFELDNLLLLGALVAGAAHLREESRGTHARIDCTATDDQRFKGRLVWRADQPPVFESLENVTSG